MDYSEDYTIVLKCIDTLPFPVGRKLLCDILRGSSSNKSIIKNKLDNNPYYGALIYTENELMGMIDWMERKKVINYVGVRGRRFVKVITLSAKGLKEMSNPTLTHQTTTIAVPKTTISEAERSAFSHMDDFLGAYNDEQKKAIISPAKDILCIAGAGSGKTTVLTKRIEFLSKYRGVNPQRILAITFTRKARQEMQKRIIANGILGVHVHTFNSFCEQLLRQHSSLLYDRPVRVMTYSDKIRMVRGVLHKMNMSPSRATYIYFTPGQRRSKSHEQLFAIFVNDLFFIIDYYKSQGTNVQDFSGLARDKTMAQIVYRMCKHLEEAKKKQGLRDFMDQLVDGLRLIRTYSNLKPQYDHVMIDEYQDVNDLQIELIRELQVPNIFVVGDPRQAIYGWRGSRLGHILDKLESSEVISLTKNYRSLPKIVDLMNKSISSMKMPDLVSGREGEAKLHLLSLPSAELEFELVTQKILELTVPREEIFVLARTNRSLNEYSRVLTMRNIPHIVRSDEVRNPTVSRDGHITLATVHAIKGLEAEVVFVMGCTSTNFPCKTSERPVIDLIKIDTYDRDEEERRLFYVALSRAKNELYMTYSTKRHSPYITDDMVALSKRSASTDVKLLKKLREWRDETADILNVPRYMVLQDSALQAAASEKPKSSQDLLRLKGFGPTTVHKYGDAIIQLIHTK